MAFIGVNKVFSRVPRVYEKYAEAVFSALLYFRFGDVVPASWEDCMGG